MTRIIVTPPDVFNGKEPLLFASPGDPHPVPHNRLRQEVRDIHSPRRQRVILERPMELIQCARVSRRGTAKSKLRSVGRMTHGVDGAHPVDDLSDQIGSATRNGDRLPEI